MAPLSAPDQSRGRALLAGALLFLIVPPIFVGLRLWSRKMKKLPLAINDYLICAGLVATTGFNVTNIIACIKGAYGQHINRASVEELEVSAKITVVSTLLWPTANTLIKLSILHFYKTVFANRSTRYATYVVASMAFLYWLGTIITAFAICQPFEYNWNKTTVKGHCANLIPYYLSTGIINLLIDVIIVAIPLPVLWNLQMKTSKKLSLSFIFSLGAGICIISIVRCVAIANLDVSDETYNIVLDETCTLLEPTLGIVSACLPLMQPVATKINGGPVFTWFRSISLMRTSTRMLNPYESKTKGRSESPHLNRQPDDLYPLTDITLTRTSQDEVKEHQEVSVRERNGPSLRS